MKTEDEKFWTWYNKGVEEGWISEPFCNTHDGGFAYMGEDEVQEWEEGGDPCATHARIMYLG